MSKQRPQEYKRKDNSLLIFQMPWYVMESPVNVWSYLCPPAPELREALEWRGGPKDTISNLAFLLPEERRISPTEVILDTFGA